MPLGKLNEQFKTVIVSEAFKFDDLNMVISNFPSKDPTDFKKRWVVKWKWYVHKWDTSIFGSVQFEMFHVNVDERAGDKNNISHILGVNDS